MCKGFNDSNWHDSSSCVIHEQCIHFNVRFINFLQFLCILFSEGIFYTYSEITLDILLKGKKRFENDISLFAIVSL